jgi:hypothetical protein
MREVRGKGDEETRFWREERRIRGKEGFVGRVFFGRIKNEKKRRRGAKIGDKGKRERDSEEIKRVKKMLLLFFSMWLLMCWVFWHLGHVSLVKILNAKPGTMF